MGYATKALAAELAKCEREVAENIDGYLKAGRALLRIKDNRFYRATHAEFEPYCHDLMARLGKHQSTAYRALSYVSTYENLAADSPIGEKLPSHESQVRALSQLPPAQQRSVWGDALRQADGGQPTARSVEDLARIAADAVARRPQQPRLEDLPPKEQLRVIEREEKAAIRAGKRIMRQRAFDRIIRKLLGAQRECREVGAWADGVCAEIEQILRTSARKLGSRLGKAA